MTTTTQRQLPNGNWIDCTEHVARFVTMAAAAQRVTEDEILARLDAGKTVRYDTDWSDNIRREPAPMAPSAPVALVLCSCGHNVPRVQVMNTSTGTSCPRCYDRMSE